MYLVYQSNGVLSRNIDLGNLIVLKCSDMILKLGIMKSQGCKSFDIAGTSFEKKAIMLTLGLRNEVIIS